MRATPVDLRSVGRATSLGDGLNGTTRSISARNAARRVSLPCSQPIPLLRHSYKSSIRDCVTGDLFRGSLSGGPNVLEITPACNQASEPGLPVSEPGASTLAE